MTEKTKEEELKQKLLDFFDKRLTDLTTKTETDIDAIEKMKFDYYDSVIIKFQEIEEEHKKEEEQEKEKEKHDKEKHDKEKHDKEKHDKEKPEKKEDAKIQKVKKEKIDPKARPKTPLNSTKNRVKLKDDKAHDTTDTHKEKKDTKTKTTGAKAPAGGKTTAGKKDAGKRPVTGKADPKAKTTTNKKGAANAKKGDKKGKKDTKKEKKEEEKKEEENAVEEAKPVIIKPKYIYTLSDDLKNNSPLSCLYFVLKGKYINDKKQILHITTNSPLLYKSFGSNMKFLLDDKKNETQKKADEIEKFLNNYGDLNNYLTKEFSLSKKAINSILLFKKKEEEEILKMPKIPKEVGMVLKCIYYLIDEPFDESLNDKELFENMINNVITKNEDKTFKSLIVNYINNNKFLNLTKEKYDKINNIINENNTISNMISMAKLCRPISLFSFMLKEVYDYINLKTLDGQFYFDLRAKNDELQKLKDILYLIEHDGKPRETLKEEKKEEPPKNEEQPKTEEPPKTEETTEQPKVDDTPKTEGVTEQPKIEETTEQPKTEETTEQTKVEEAPKTEETVQQSNTVEVANTEGAPQA